MKKKTKAKEVKAWAILDLGGELVDTPRGYCIRKYQVEAEMCLYPGLKESIVPVLITILE